MRLSPLPEPIVTTQTPNTDAEILHIYDRWHESVVKRDLDGVVALYDEHAVLESPLVMIVSADRQDGRLRGKDRIAAFFEQGFRSPENGLGRWYRTGTFFSNGRLLTWEYPRETPEGDQVDLVEVMDVERGLIVHHRVYWGWVGVKALLAVGR
ncbi:nuclear transport factor 2 family protein [Paraburkholderia phosphatilytica]|uniref:nuclear transport factor 2 family protein n=1 Tax=Paraburkholderia phosphatilytica TaxID=2282883 RepID=UPI000E543A14|nr:nuclear transport factor 2 family protein [Paraburkholderia phosphatilytica]